MKSTSAGKKKTAFYWKGDRCDMMTTLLKTLKKEFPFAIGSTPFLWQLIFFYLPLTILLTTSLFTADFTKIFTIPYFKVIISSIILASTTTLICLTSGFPLAYCIVFHGKRFKNFLLFLLLIPFWTNFILHIYAWFFVLERNGFVNTLLLQLGCIQDPIPFLNSHFAILLMMVYFYLPFMVLPIFSSLERFDPSLLEASLDLGANKFQTIRRILIPISMNAIRSGIYLVFIPSFGEFVIPELMGGAKDLFIGNVISLFVMDHHTAPLGIAFTVLSIASLLLILACIHKGLTKLSRLLTGGIYA